MFHSGDLLAIRDDRWRVVATRPQGDTTFVDAAGAAPRNRCERATFILPFDAWQRIDPGRPRVVSAARWRHAARAAIAEALPQWWSLRSAASGSFDIYPYQLAPALALVRGAANRFLLADAVGLGKTVQAALMVAETLARRSSARAIVVCPAGLRDQWLAELQSRFGLAPCVIDSPALARIRSELPPHVNPWGIGRVIVTSIDFVKRPEVMRALEGSVWDIAVFDEAHNLVSRSDRATAAGLVARRARHVVLLTATPHAGDAQSFERLCQIGQLARDPILVFRRLQASAGLAGQTRTTFLRVQPSEDERQMHDRLTAYARTIWHQPDASSGQRLLVSLLLRRASSSASALARSVLRRIALLEGQPDDKPTQPTLPYAAPDLEPESQLGIRGLPDTASELDRLRGILRVARRAAANESKIAAIARMLRRIHEPVIVFTEYRDTVEQVARALNRGDTSVLHGGLTARERAEVIGRFTAGSAQLLLSTDAGSEGLNLHQRCRLVVNLDVPWMPHRAEQRAGRVDRIGQARRVHVIHLVAADTSEEFVVARLLRRQLYSSQMLNRLACPSEEQIGAAAIGGTVEEQPMSELGLPEGVVTTTPGAAEESESIRVRSSRMLRRDSHRDPQPVIARIRRRKAKPPAVGGCLWLFASVCAGKDDLLLWDAPLALAAGEPWPDNRSRAATRRRLDERHVSASDLVNRWRIDLERALRQELGPGLDRWRQREEAIRQHLHDHHGLMSPALMQRALFDHRAERHAAARREELHEAVSGCDARLDELSALAKLTVGEPVCVFGVLRE